VIVLGIDPGSVNLGWAALSLDGARREHLASGSYTIDARDGRTVRDVVGALRAFAAGVGAVGLIAVERVEQVNARAGFGSTMASALCLAHGVGQRLAQAFEDDRYHVAEFTAETWHRHFTAARAIDGQAVAAIIANQLRGWPKRSNAHARDAACIALYAGTILAPRQPTVAKPARQLTLV
jgi:Holliday junction resolvasome RuvABC endonuclease subunit